MKTKNKVIISAVIIALAVGGYLVGTALSKKSKAKNKIGAGFNFQRDSNSSRPDRDPEIMGKIQAVNENKITIGKFEIPSRDNSRKKEGIAQMFSVGGQRGGEMRAKMREQQKTAAREREIIGEETLVINAETKIFKRPDFKRIPNGNEKNEINLEEISLDNINEGGSATVWIKQDDADEKVAEFIIITNKL